MTHSDPHLNAAGYCVCPCEDCTLRLTKDCVCELCVCETDDEGPLHTIEGAP